MFSDTDIRNQIEVRRNDSSKGISIEPFKDKYLTPVGYDLRIGIKGFSWNNKREIDIGNDKRIEIEPNDTVVIETLESVSLSKEIAGTIHSMVSQTVPQGLSHISTTVDPGWTGKLLISVHNYRDCSIEIRFQDSFCTICFHKVESESKVSLGRPVDRDDLWQRLLEKAKEEKDRQVREQDRKNEKSKKEVRVRISLLVIFILSVIFVGFLISFKNPNLGAAFATFIAAFSPIINERLKPSKGIEY